MARKSRQSGGERSTSPSTRGRDHSGRVALKRPKGDDAVALELPKRWTMLVILASTLGVALGVVMIALNLISVRTSVPAATQVKLVSVPQGPDRHSVGNPNAPVVITEWSDFQCPACRLYALTREPIIEQQYLASGQVRFVYHNFPFLGPESLLAAEAAECAGDQGRYLDYRNMLWQRQQGENQGAFSADKLKGFAADLGLDQSTFNACLDNGVHRAELIAEQKEGVAQGVSATPTIFINGLKIQGVPSVEAMKSVIEEDLAKNK